MPDVRHKRGTRAALNALAAANKLVPFQVYLISDEAHLLAVATSVSTYDTYLKGATTPASKLIVSRDQYNFQTIGGAFTTIEVNSVKADNKAKWNQATYSYKITEPGYYDCFAKVRSTDNTGARSIGVGIDTANQDSDTFMWDTFPTTADTNRFVLQNRVIREFAVDDEVRLFGYNNGIIVKAYLALIKMP